MNTPYSAAISLSRPTILSVAIVAASSTLADSSSITEEMVVWGTQVRASSVNLREENIAIRQADHISDLLRTMPGVDVGGAHSLNQRITIRSMDDKDLRITIDGANQNTYMYHHMGNLQIHADILKSVDVNVGTNSVVNGGLGGAVRFETKSAANLLHSDQRFGSRLQATYGDNSGTNYAFTGYGQLTDQLDVLVYHNQVDRDNYEVGGGVIRDGRGGVVTGSDGTVRGLEGELKDSLIKFGWNISENQRLTFGYETYADEGNYSFRPDMGLATDTAITNNLRIPLLWPTAFDRDTLTLNYDLQWGVSSTLKATLFSNESELYRDESGFTQNPAFARFAAYVTGTAENTGLNILGETETGIHTLTYGMEVINYDTEYRRAGLSGRVDASNEEATNKALYIQDRIQLTDSFVLIPGLRYDNFDLDSAVVDKRFTDVSAALAAEYQVRDNLLLKLSATQLFKGPEIGEVFIGAGLRDTANPDIQEETGINSELSLAFEDSVLGADRFAVGFTLFQTDIDNYIYDYAPPPPSVGGRSWKDNIGDMTIDGVEAYVGYDFGEFNLLLTYSKTDSELDAFTQYRSRFNGARLDRQQGNTFSLNVDYKLPTLNLELHWDVLAVGDVDDGLNLDGATLNNAKDSYMVHNLSARWSPTSDKQGLTLTFGVDNLFDEFYASQSSRTGTSVHPRFGELYLLDYEPGRNLKVTASYRF